MFTKTQTKNLTVQQLYNLQKGIVLREDSFKEYLESVYYHLDKKQKKKTTKK